MILINKEDTNFQELYEHDKIPLEQEFGIELTQLNFAVGFVPKYWAKNDLIIDKEKYVKVNPYTLDWGFDQED